jgi:hypothetical protein
MSWLYSQALVAAYSAQNCLDGEPFAQLNVMPTQAKFWRNDKTMESSNLSQFGLTLQLLTADRGEALLTWYLAGFHAKTSAPQEKALASKAQEAECGKKWHGLLAKYDPNTCLWKTAQCSLLEDLEQSLETWPRWGTMQNGECFRRPMLAQITLESGFGLSGRTPNNIDFFHTSCTTGIDGGSNSRKALRKRMETYPTPNAGMYRNLNYNKELCFKRAEKHQTDLAMVSVMQFGGQLNPAWAEWLMGWPVQWTELKPLETDKYHFVQQQHGDC